MHMAASHWGFVLMAIHLGMHWGIFTSMAEKTEEKTRKTKMEMKNSSPAGRIIPMLLGAVIAVYGLTAFIRRDMLTYMFLQSEFVFLDYGEPVLLFYTDYLAMMGLFIFGAHYGVILLRRTGQGSRQTKRK